MSRGMSSPGNFIFMLAFALILVFALSVILGPLLRRTPTIEVTECSLTSDTISNNGLTSVTFTIKSNDKSNPHNIRVEFVSHQLVTFMLGSQTLPKQEDVWYYEETLNPTASHTQLINIRASLESGIGKLAYRITINFQSDGQQFYNKNLDLTVQR
jgi:hypothetical protein